MYNNIVHNNIEGGRNIPNQWTVYLNTMFSLAVILNFFMGATPLGFYRCVRSPTLVIPSPPALYLEWGDGDANLNKDTHTTNMMSNQKHISL